MYRTVVSAFALVSLLSLGAPEAMAGGMITIKKHGDARFMRFLDTGLTIAKIVQDGKGNSSALQQLGHNNFAFDGQFGSGHSSSIVQTGNNNAGAVLQFGNGTSSNLHETGGQSDLIVQFGW